jgi:hypothetical protein
MEWTVNWWFVGYKGNELLNNRVLRKFSPLYVALNRNASMIPAFRDAGRAARRDGKKMRVIIFGIADIGKPQYEKGGVMTSGSLKKGNLYQKNLERLTTLNALFESGLDGFRLAKYLINPDTDAERNVVRDKSPFPFLTAVLWRDTIISFAKIFPDSANDKFNIQKYIRFIQANKRLLRKTDAQKLSGYQDSLKANRVIDQIKADRDNYYAHTDRDVKISYNMEYVNCLTQLCRELSQMLIVLYFDLLDGGLLVSHEIEPQDHEKKFLKDMAEFDRIKAGEIIKDPFH